MFYFRYICLISNVFSWRYHIAITVAKENPNCDYFFLCASQNEKPVFATSFTLSKLIQNMTTDCSLNF